MESAMAFLLVASLYPILMGLGWFTHKVFLRMRRYQDGHSSSNR